MFCDSLRCDLLGTKVRVTEIAPGRVQTSLYRTALGAEGANEKLYDAYRSIQPENIAELIATAIALPEAVDVSRMEVFP
ncbi:SDR family NAD(P)-dependent oxidoreductase, partial [Paraburkholderia sp. SIMBA_061]